MGQLRISFLVFFIALAHISVCQVSIGDNPPDSSAILDLQSTERGLLLPRLSTTEMNSIASPGAGLVIFNTSVNTIFYFDGAEWNMMEFREGESCGIVTYEGETYETVIIGEQCWLKENLNVGLNITAATPQTNNNIIEKYCYDNHPDSCDIYGGLYQWDELMQYTDSAGAQGICPSGWHIPTDEDWMELEGHVDSQYPAGDPEWSGYSARGYDAGYHLKAESGWIEGNGDDSYGFTALPGGTSLFTGGIGWGGMWWTSSEYDQNGAINRMLVYSSDEIYRDIKNKQTGYSVRCVKD